MEGTVDRPISCATFRQQLYHFQADELSEAERLVCSEHLDGCDECVRLLEVEDGFASALKSRLRRETAPPELVLRVREALAAEARPVVRRSWIRAPWAAALAASVVLALLLIPGLSGRLQSTPVSPGVPVERLVTLVDLECDRAGHDAEFQRQCAHPRHVNALKLGPKHYWSLSLADGPGRALVTDRSLRGHLLRVEGTFHAGIDTLHVTGFEDLGPERLAGGSAGATASVVPAAL
jgi:anti-sigma factor (TIGR02949 family)